jgi:deoxyribonuclease-4
VPPIGVHTSIAGGVRNALVEAERLGCEAIQIFTKNASQWVGKETTAAEAEEFRRGLRRLGLKCANAHDSYLINLATSDPALWRKSVEAFVDEMRRAEALGLRYLVAHPGAHMGAGEEIGIANVARALDETHKRCDGFRVKVLLELTAGQGTSLGYRFEHLRAIIDQSRFKRRLGVCFDTCHALAAGYPLYPESAYDITIREFDRIVGLRRLKLFHLNDSKKPCGSRVDRHEHIGKGCLGLEPFRFILNDARFQKIPMILETPKHDEAGKEMDPVNMATLRGLVKG